MAAQYGQTAFLYHVALRWGADIDCLDSGNFRCPCCCLHSLQQGHKGAVSSAALQGMVWQLVLRWHRMAACNRAPLLSNDKLRIVWFPACPSILSWPIHTIGALPRSSPVPLNSSLDPAPPMCCRWAGPPALGSLQGLRGHRAIAAGHERPHEPARQGGLHAPALGRYPRQRRSLHLAPAGRPLHLAHMWDLEHALGAEAGRDCALTGISCRASRASCSEWKSILLEG